MGCKVRPVPMAWKDPKDRKVTKDLQV